MKHIRLITQIAVVLALIDFFFPGAHTALPLGVIMWAEYVSGLLIIFAGLYSCTMTGIRRERWRRRVAKVFELSVSSGFSYMKRLGLACLMIFAGWPLTATVYVTAIVCMALVAGEVRKWTFTKSGPA